tara:strand:+ start:1099 stop:2448 length:1350 start_codon:yes stop_codon:yes gene_type:complete
MYKTPYKSMYRIQTIEEALEFDIQKDHCDMYLYLIDIYDVLLSAAIQGVEIPDEKLKLQRRKVHNYLMEHFHRLYLPIPGRLYGWSHNMLLYVIVLTMIEMQYKSEYPVIPEHVHEYCVKNRVRMYQDRDTKTWQLHTFLDMLDVLSLRWRNLLPCEEQNELLEIIWRISAKMIIFMHSETVLNMEDYVDPIIINDEVSKYVRMNVTGIIAGLSRYYWFHQTIAQWTRWEEEPIEIQPVTNWDQWIVVEKKHLVTRRFRDALSDFLWDIIINYGDHAIAAHDQLGDQVSNYACLYMRFPAQVPTGLSRICTYKEYEDMIASDTIREMLFAKMIHQHFRSNYDVDFMKIFTVWEPKMWKHIRGIERSPVPLILNMYYRFRVFYRGKMYRHPEGTSMKHAFIVWLTILRKECGGVCFNSMDFNPTIEAMLDKKEIVNNTRDLGIFFDLQDD